MINVAPNRLLVGYEYGNATIDPRCWGAAEMSSGTATDWWEGGSTGVETTGPLSLHTIRQADRSRASDG
jgi:hypothetical protein